MEAQEFDAWIYANDDLNLDKVPWTLGWVTQLLKSNVDFGKPLNVGRIHKGWMEEAGFVHVEEKVVKVLRVVNSKNMLSSVTIRPKHV